PPYPRPSAAIPPAPTDPASQWQYPSAEPCLRCSTSRPGGQYPPESPSPPGGAEMILLRAWRFPIRLELTCPPEGQSRNLRPLASCQDQTPSREALQAQPARGSDKRRSVAISSET